MSNKMTVNEIWSKTGPPPPNGSDGSGAGSDDLLHGGTRRSMGDGGGSVALTVFLPGNVPGDTPVAQLVKADKAKYKRKERAHCCARSFCCVAKTGKEGKRTASSLCFLPAHPETRRAARKTPEPDRLCFPKNIGVNGVEQNVCRFLDPLGKQIFVAAVV